MCNPDAFRFYAVETNLPKVVLSSDAMIPRARSAVGWVYDHQRVHVRPHLRERLFIEDESYLQEGLGRMINLPMVVQDACLGTLNIGSIGRAILIQTLSIFSSASGDADRVCHRARQCL